MSENNSIKITRKLLTRIFSKIKKSTENFYKGVPCWEWTAFINKKTGYAGFSNGRNKFVSGHKFIYQVFVGEIADNLECDHLCRVRHCVNPAHIEPVTRVENQHRSNSVSGYYHRQTHCKRGHEFKGKNLRIDTYGKNGRLRRRCQECHRQNQRDYVLRNKT